MTAVVPYRGIVPFGTASGSLSTLAINSSGDKLGAVFDVRDTADLTGAVISYSSLSTSATYKVGFQGVDSSGHPDGTYLGGGSPASTTFTPSGSEGGTCQEYTLDNAYTPTRGERVALVVEYDSGTISSGITLYYRHGVYRMGYPYAVWNIGSGWNMTSYIPCGFGVVQSSNRWGYPVVNHGVTTATTSGHRVAAKINRPTGAGTTYNIVGIEFISSSSTSTDYKIGLWDSSSTLQEAAIAAPVAAVGSGVQIHYFDESSLSDLSYGTDYYLGIERTATGNVTVYDWDCHSTTFAGHWNRGTLATYNGTTWTESTDGHIAEIVPIYSDETCSGGGGAIVNQGLHAIGSGIMA